MNTGAGVPDTSRLLLGGQWVEGSAPPLARIDPATGESLPPSASAGPDQVDAAVRAGHAALARSGWARLQPHRRAAVLHRMADLLGQRREALALAQMQDNGKPWAECLTQAAGSAAAFRYYAGVCETVGAELTPPRGDYLSMALWEPYGVVAAVTPWNSPLTMEAQKVAPALAAGNAVVLKPAEITPGAALALGAVAVEAGLPEGLLSVLPGTGAVTGAALAAHPGVGMLSFTGGTATGRALARAAGARLLPVALELGGKSPHIVFADADLDEAARQVAAGIFEGAGQSCVAGSRLFVQRSVYPRVLAAVVDIARSLRLDLPQAQGVQMGPIASFAQRRRIATLVDEAVAAGARLCCGGAAPADAHLQAGAFYRPTVLEGFAPDAAILREEVFGPVLCALPFDDEADLIAQANASAYGLAAGLWSRDFGRCWRVAGALQAGSVWINTYKQLSIATPFGGYKDSGLGREKGIGGLRLYQQAKSVYIGLGGWDPGGVA